MNFQSKDGIGYCDATWNPVTGCLGPGGTPKEPRRCPYPCYAETLANGRLQKLYTKYGNAIIDRGTALGAHTDPFWPRYWEWRLEQPQKRRKRTRIFVCDMADLFHAYVPTEVIDEVLASCRRAPQHIYLFLTKNPARYADFAPWPDNCWLGTTVTNQQDWDERWPEMDGLKAAVKWVSFEPVLGAIDLAVVPDQLAWAVIGAQTGPLARQPNAEWVTGLVTDDLGLFGVPVFTKDNLDCEGMGIERRREMPR